LAKAVEQLWQTLDSVDKRDQLGSADRDQPRDLSDGGIVTESKIGPKRSLLAQGRSRETRQSIIKAALELWSERGYDTGIDDTTAEEIAARAGVAKATFYFHFARKDDILFEVGWLTAKVLYEDALKALMTGGTTDEIIDSLLLKLCRRIEKVPRLALRRMLQLQSSRPESPVPQADDPDHFGFQRAFTVVFIQAQQTGDIAPTVAPGSLGCMFEALLFGAIRDRAYYDQVDLLALLRERSAVLLAGARHVSEEAISAASARRPKSRSRSRAV
jgi:AcrR family transcriptional regulator